MKNIRNKLFLFIFIVIALTLGACSKMEVYNKNYYNAASANYFSLPPLEPSFYVCSSLFTKKEDVDYTAALTCATKNKKPEFIAKTYFHTCYLIKPVASNYKCV
ncbi:hypothetical protein HPDP_00349 [Candidatus Hepatincola sp. Pdp]